MLPSIGKILHSPAPPKLVLPPGSDIFQAGEIFRGKILKRYSPGEVLIQAKGKEFTGQTSLRLQAGASYYFQAVRIGQKIELRVREDLPRDLKPLLKFWSACRTDGQKMGELLKVLSGLSSLKDMPANLAKALSNFNLLLPMLIYSGGDGPRADWLAKFLFVSGLFWESKLAKALSNDRRSPQRALRPEDLKGCLLRLKQDLSPGPGKSEEMDSIRDKIEQALRMIQQEQWLNYTLSRNGLGFYWSMPGPGEEGFKRAEILVDQASEEGVVRFCLMLDFSRLGQVLAEFIIVEANLDLTFLVEDKKIKELMVKHLDDLRNGLEDSGFTLGHVSCRTGEEIDHYMNRLVEERASERAIHLVI